MLNLQSLRCIRVISFWNFISVISEKHFMFTSCPPIKKIRLVVFQLLKEMMIVSHYFSLLESWSRANRWGQLVWTFGKDNPMTPWPHLDSAWILAVCLSSSSATFFLSRSVSCLRPAECSISPSNRLRRDLWNTHGSGCPWYWHLSGF